MDMLLTKGAKASARGPEGKTALMLAAAGGHCGAVNLLLTATKSLKNGLAEAQALIEERDEMGRTALMHGAAAGHAATVRALLLAGDSPYISPHLPASPCISLYLPGAQAQGAEGSASLTLTLTLTLTRRRSSSRRRRCGGGKSRPRWRRLDNSSCQPTPTTRASWA